MSDTPQNQPLPWAPDLNVAALAALFRHTTNSYKFIFFLALLEILRQRRFAVSRPIAYADLTIEMLATAWFPHTFFKLSFGTQDTIAKKLDALDLSGANLLTGDRPALRAALAAADLGDAHRLMDFVPYRLLIPFLEPELQGIDRGAWMVFEKAMPRIANAHFAERRPLYRFDADDYAHCSGILIHPAWAAYLEAHHGIVQGWAAWHWLHYMQRRNPSTPALSSKLFAPAKRNPLGPQTKYWRAILAHPDGAGLRCIYTGAPLDTGFALDHYLPWSFVAHDQLWNLIPAPAPINAAKSNRLPSERYFDGFVSLQHQGLQVARQVFGEREYARFAEDYVADLHLEPAALSDLEALRGAYRRNLVPLLTLAANQGFIPGWECERTLVS